MLTIEIDGESYPAEFEMIQGDTLTSGLIYGEGLMFSFIDATFEAVYLIGSWAVSVYDL